MKSILGFVMYILGFVIPFCKFDDKIKVKTNFGGSQNEKTTAHAMRSQYR